jgi:hypothetical protein
MVSKKGNGGKKRKQWLETEKDAKKWLLETEKDAKNGNGYQKWK